VSQTAVREGRQFRRESCFSFLKLTAKTPRTSRKEKA
jgi:hypothetical protein